jgi:hypothetical protein
MGMDIVNKLSDNLKLFNNNDQIYKDLFGDIAKNYPNPFPNQNVKIADFDAGAISNVLEYSNALGKFLLDCMGQPIEAFTIIHNGNSESCKLYIDQVRNTISTLCTDISDNFTIDMSLHQTIGSLIIELQAIPNYTVVSKNNDQFYSSNIYEISNVPIKGRVYTVKSQTQPISYILDWIGENLYTLLRRINETDYNFWQRIIQTVKNDKCTPISIINIANLYGTNVSIQDDIRIGAYAGLSYAGYYEGIDDGLIYVTPALVIGASAYAFFILTISGLTSDNYGNIIDDINRFRAAGVNYLIRTTPDTPATAPVLTSGSTIMNLSWTTLPGSTSYELWYNTSNDSESAIYFGDVAITSGTITGLTNGVLYYFWYKGKNGVGVSLFSPSANATPT